MIKITCKDEAYFYNIYHIVKAFFPSEDVEQNICEEALEQVSVQLADGQEFAVSKEDDDKKMRKYLLDRSVYEFCRDVTGENLSWGILTGVRPAKIAMQKVEAGMNRSEFVRWFQEDSLVSREKAELAYDIAVREREILKELDYQMGYSLYVGIPFCPTVCSYCSFSSGSISAWKDYVEDYLHALCKELVFVSEVSAKKKLNTIYIGGGTPTTLSAEQLEMLLSCIDDHFSREYLLEYTVEAGRPDSITGEKLAVLKRHGVTRISINPQTMQQRTLDVIGRRHTAGEVEESFRMAREMGFTNINMDLIAGLPGETLTDMEGTLSRIKELAPDSLTVHSLAIKRAAKMGQEKNALGYVKDLKEQTEHPEKMARELKKMIDAAACSVKEMGLEPYYLYRQKNIAGNFENVGYAKVDKAGIYNILIMEEKQSIVAVGAGASTKIVLPDPIVIPGSRKQKTTTLMRVENVKNIREYIERIDEMIERKGEWLWR